MKNLVFKINHASGWDAWYLRIMPKKMTARRFAKKLLASDQAWKGMLPGFVSDAKFFMIMPDGQTWEVISPLGDVIEAQRPHGVPINA